MHTTCWIHPPGGVKWIKREWLLSSRSTSGPLNCLGDDLYNHVDSGKKRRGKKQPKKTEAEGEAGSTERKGAGGNGDRSTDIQDVSMIETCDKNKKKGAGRSVSKRCFGALQQLYISSIRKNENGLWSPRPHPPWLFEKSNMQYLLIFIFLCTKTDSQAPCRSGSKHRANFMDITAT